MGVLPVVGGSWFGLDGSMSARVRWREWWRLSWSIGNWSNEKSRSSLVMRKRFFNVWKREKRSGPFGRNELQYSRTRQEPGCFLSNETGLLYLEESVLEGGSLEFGQL